MSSFFVSDEIIHDITALYLPDLNAGDTLANEFGVMLLEMNTLSLKARYNQDPAEYQEFIDGYDYAKDDSISQIQRLKSMKCFLYQCSEGNVPEMDFHRALSEFAEQKTLELAAGNERMTFGEMKPFIAGYEEAEWARGV